MRSIQLHKSSFLVGLLAAVVMVLICVPGMNRDQQFIGSYADADVRGVFDHGWPVFYLTRKIEHFPQSYHGVPARTAPWRSWDCWNLNDGTITWFSLANLLVGIVACSAFVLAAMALWEYRRRLRTGPWQITLREMFAVTLAMASAFGWLAYERNELRHEATHIDFVHNLDKDLGDGAPIIFATRRPDLPVLMIRLIGPASIPEFLWRCRELDASPSLEGDYTRFSDAMPHLLELSRANYMSVGIPPDGASIPFDDIERLHQVRSLELWTFDYEMEEPWQIGADDLRKLQHLDLIIFPSRSSISAECAAILEKEMPSCRVEFENDE